MIKKLKKYGFFQFGEIIPNLKINGEEAPYPVTNERAVRAGAGIMLMMGIFAFTNALLLKNFDFLKVVVVIFFFDFLMKVVIGSRFSPMSALGEWIVKNQKPEYIGMVQKRFAWGIGLIMASTMVILVVLLNVRGPINLVICLFCLTVMWLETSFGICVGCKMYYGLIKLKLIKEPHIKPACPGGVCQLK
jgi:hypothetical protein